MCDANPTASLGLCGRPTIALMRCLMCGLSCVLLCLMAACGEGSSAADDSAKPWSQRYPVVTVGVTPDENQANLMDKFGGTLRYFEQRLGVEVRWYQASSYAGIIQGLDAGKVDVAKLGPASYARAYMVMGGGLEPIAVELDAAGRSGYHSAIAVRADSPYQRVDDLAGKVLGFTDPNSTSGFQAPRFFLNEAGYNPTTFFKETVFAGGHENGLVGVVNGTFDAAATSYVSDSHNRATRMDAAGMIEAEQVRFIWMSPMLPSSPWLVRSALPESMRHDLAAALLELPEADADAWAELTGGLSAGVAPVSHADYEPVIRMIRENLRNRREQ